MRTASEASRELWGDLSGAKATSIRAGKSGDDPRGVARRD